MQSLEQEHQGKKQEVKMLEQVLEIMKKNKMRKDAVPLKVMMDSADPDVDFVIGQANQPGGERCTRRPKSRIEEVFDDLEEFTMVDSKQQASGDSLYFPLVQSSIEAKSPAIARRDKTAPHPKDPMVWWKLSDLFSLCGPLMTVFIVMQVISSLSATHALMRLLNVDHHMTDGMLIAGFILIDGGVLVSNRGRRYTKLAVPMIWVSVITIMPGMLCLAWMKIYGLN